MLQSELMAGDDKSNPGTAQRSSSSYKINLDQFSRRLKSLYSQWGFPDVLTIATPPHSDVLRYLKSSAMNIWLFGFEFPETIMVFTKKKKIHFLCSKTKALVLESMRKTTDAEVVIHIKAKNDDGAALMDKILRSVREEEKGKKEVVIGHIGKEAIEGALMETWNKKLQNEDFRLEDVSEAITDLLAVKDPDELLNIKNAASLTANVMKSYVVPRLENIVDKEKRISHSSLMDETEKVITNPSRVHLKLKPENVDICYPPIFQSGGRFDLRPGEVSDDELLYYGPGSVIVCSIGSSFNQYCSNLARTILIAAGPEQRKAYRVLLKAQESAINALRPGSKISAAYEAAVALVGKEAPELLPSMTRSVGAGIGLEFRDSGLSLTGKNNRLVKENMVFNVSIGFKNLENRSSPKQKHFSLLVADTVVVTKDKTEVATRVSSKTPYDVCWEFNEEPKPEVKELLPLKTKLRSDTKDISKEELRRQHQAELARQKNEETARRLAGQETSSGGNRRGGKSLTELAAYKTVNDVPTFRDLMIQVDQKNEAVLLPIYGSMVPFHVGTIRNISSQQETSQNCYIRINFNFPDPNLKNFQTSIHLKDVSFRSKDPKHVLEVVQLIKNLRRQFLARESERADRASLVSQEKLKLAGQRFKPVKLSELWIRPGFAGRGRNKIPGTLEAHVNGFRYSVAQERVDIMFSNIKHAIFQPAEREMITLLHFNLHNEIMVGNKKTKDVQFYVEVMEAVQTIGGRRRSGYDPDEIEEEQRERDRMYNINKKFLDFVNRVNDIWAQGFDEPVRELGFHGVPFKSSVFVVPTTYCLVELTEVPFLVVTLSEVEIVNLERAVDLGQRNFDMAIVFKDFKKDVVRIDSIPRSSLEGIKGWLDSTDIKYYESKINMNWKAILKTVIDDPEGFVEGGGWDFLNLEASDDESESGSESDKGYEPSDLEMESGSDDEDESDSNESLVESEEEDSEDSEEERGKSWDELEREASNADRARGDESGSEEDRRRRKLKVSGKCRVGPSGSIPKRPRFR